MIEGKYVCLDCNHINGTYLTLKERQEQEARSEENKENININLSTWNEAAR